MKILVFGATGLIGYTIARVLNQVNSLEVVGVSRRAVGSFSSLFDYLGSTDLLVPGEASYIFANHKPDVVINCVGVTKHVTDGVDPVKAISTNSLLPHELSNLSSEYGARFIHISTDCVYDGLQGGYKEEQLPNAIDLYGRTKALGELLNKSDLVIRTSTIGHEKFTSNGLLEWFLGQKSLCFGYKNAYFSGLTTLELAEVILNHVLPKRNLAGLYHLAGPRISKFDLLQIMRKVYGIDMEIREDFSLRIDRSLNGDKFLHDTGYASPSWETMILSMKMDYEEGGGFV